LEARRLFEFLRWLNCNKPNVKSILISTQAADANFYLDVAANHVNACVSDALLKGSRWATAPFATMRTISSPG
jgi:hypothetical protein